MTIKKYLNDFWNMTIEHPGFPFLPDAYLSDNRSFVFDKDFQDKLTNYIYTKHGRKELAESIFEDVAEYTEKEIEDLTTEDIYTYIQFLCSSIYEANLYKYNTLEATTHLDYNPIENYNRTEEFHNVDTYGGQTSKTVEGGETVSNTYGSINTRDEFGKIDKETLKGEQDNTFGRQQEENIFSKEVETVEHGEIDKNTNTRDEIGNKTDSTIHGATQEENKYGEKVTNVGAVITDTKHGATSETNIYGEKVQNIGKVVTDTEHGEKNNVVGGIEVNDNFGEHIKDTKYDDTHKVNMDSTSVGVSSYDVDADFGDSGVTQSGDNYVIGNNGDSAYNPKERTLTDRVENIDEHTDTETDKAHQDTHFTSSQHNQEGAYNDKQTVDEHNIIDNQHTDNKLTNEINDKETVQAHDTVENQHTDLKSTNEFVDTTNYGGHLELHNNTEHTNQEDDKTTKDAHNVTLNKSAYTNTEGIRNDKETVNSHIDFHTQSDHTDTVSSSGKEISNIVGEKRDRHLIDGNVHGNIGVMSTQNMIQQEREVALFSIFEIVSRDIISQIACTVY